jgi:hemoglobin
MNIHRELHSKQELNPALFERWLSLFLATVDESYSGECAERAKQVATSIAGNMQASLL